MLACWRIDPQHLNFEGALHKHGALFYDLWTLWGRAGISELTVF